MQAKLGVEGAEQDRLRREMVKAYVEGLCWVMRYYYDGALHRSVGWPQAARAMLFAHTVPPTCLPPPLQINKALDLAGVQI